MIKTYKNRSPLIKLKRIGLFIAIIPILVTSLSIDTFAASKFQREDAYKASEWDDQESNDACASDTSDTPSQNTSTPGKVFILGDSIGVGISSTLPNHLKAEDGWVIASDSVVGRRLDQAIPVAQGAPPGLKEAQHVLVVLGTNPSNKNTGGGIQELIGAIETANPNVSITWLGTNVTKAELMAGATEFNRLLSSSVQIKYIENTIAPTAGDGVHYNDYDPLAELVSQSFKEGSDVSTDEEADSSESCTCTSSGSGSTVDKSLTLGSEGIERRVKLMKLLIADFGLSPEQAAGIIGNFMQESGGEHLPPDVNEGTSTGAPPNMGNNKGYGWAQWSFSRKFEFIQFSVDNGFMESSGVNATDAANYAFLKHELNNSPTYKITIPNLKNQNTATEAAWSFHKDYERSGDDISQIGERGTSAEQALAEFKAANSSGGNSGTGGGSVCGDGQVAIVGEYAFPLITTKQGVQNRNIFKDNTTNRAGHPYIAYDILVAAGTPTVAFISGKVTHITQDKCPGRFISVYNAESNLTISYLHLDFNNHAAEGDELTVGQQLGVIGPAPNGCGTEHLHIDAVEGNKRPGCSRESCPSKNQKFFRDIGPQLFETYQKLPES